MSANVYRLPLPPVPARGPLRACPACGTTMLRIGCRHCGAARGEFKTICEACKARGGAKDSAGAEPSDHLWVSVYKNAAVPRYCSPAERVVVSRSGWWVFARESRCDEPGTHLHQRCDACGWRGVLLPKTEDA